MSTPVYQTLQTPELAKSTFAGKPPVKAAKPKKAKKERK